MIVSVTAMVIKNDKVLITKRHPQKKLWPNKWTFPGGRLQESDYIGKPTLINNQWYNTLEFAVKREVLEEVGLEIGWPEYVCNIAIPGSLIVSFKADYVDGSITLQEDEAVAYEWVTLAEAAEYDLIDGLIHELGRVLSK